MFAMVRYHVVSKFLNCGGVCAILPSARSFGFLALKAGDAARFTFDLLLATVETSQCKTLARLVCLRQTPSGIDLLSIHLSRNSMAVFVQMICALACYLLHANVLPLRLVACVWCGEWCGSIADCTTISILCVF